MRATSALIGAPVIGAFLSSGLALAQPASTGDAAIDTGPEEGTSFTLGARVGGRQTTRVRLAVHAPAPHHRYRAHSKSAASERSNLIQKHLVRLVNRSGIALSASSWAASYSRRERWRE